MTKVEFADFITGICSYLSHKQPEKETLALWYHDCFRIPQEALISIRSQFRDLETWPKNLPKWLWAQFNLWLEANPEKKAPEKKGCDQCHEGWIMVSRFDARVKYRVDVPFRCGNCNQDPGAIPAKNRLQLIEEGYCKPTGSIVRAYHKPFSDPPGDEDGLKTWQSISEHRPALPLEDGLQSITHEDLPF